MIEIALISINSIFRPLNYYLIIIINKEKLV